MKNNTKNTHSEQGEKVALLFMKSENKGHKWLSVKQANWLKSYMEKDNDTKQYFADFGSLTISPLNQCGSFNYLGSPNFRKDEFKKYLKEQKEIKKEMEKTEIISNILEESNKLKIHPNEYMKIKGIIIK